MTEQKKCDRFSDEDLSRYLDGEVAAEVVLQIEDHLKNCSRCRLQQAKLNALREALREASEVPDPPDQWFRIRCRLQDRPHRQAPGPLVHGFWKRWLPLAAGIVLSILAVSVFWPFGSAPSTDVEPYLGLYLLAVDANDMISSQIEPGKLNAQELGFEPRLPPSIHSWKRQRTYYHKLHGQPVVQVFYEGEAGEQYCIFQQSDDRPLDFGSRETQQELVQNQICTKFVDRHFNLISWRKDGTLFTLVSTSPDLDVGRVASQWIKAEKE